MGYFQHSQPMFLRENVYYIPKVLAFLTLKHNHEKSVNQIENLNVLWVFSYVISMITAFLNYSFIIKSFAAKTMLPIFHVYPYSTFYMYHFTFLIFESTHTYEILIKYIHTNNQKMGLCVFISYPPIY